MNANTKMNTAPKPGKLERFSRHLKDKLSAAARGPPASGSSFKTTPDSQDTSAPSTTSLLHLPASQLQSRPPSPGPGHRDRTSSSQANAVGSALPCDSLAPPVAAQNHVHTREASSMLADALEALDEQERDTVRKLLSPKTVEVDAALDEAHSKARELRARGAMKGWSWTYRDRQVNVQDQADKLLRFIDKFKSVGDAVGSIDPIHVGLPWAGVRTILEVCRPEPSAL